MGDKLLILWKSYITDKVILQMVRGDTIEFENDNTRKHNGESPSFFPRRRGRIPCYLGTNFA